MEYDNSLEIRRLLDLYLDGETTCAQECRLKEYFMSEEDIPTDLLYAKAIFEGFAAIAVEEYTGKKELTPQSGSAIVRRSGSEHISTINPEPAQRRPASGGSTLSPRRGVMKRIYMAVSIAASLLVVLGLARVLVQESKPTVYCYMNGQPVTDINVAARQAQMIARLLEGGARASADGIAKASEASGKIGNALQKLDTEQ